MYELIVYPIECEGGDIEWGAKYLDFSGVVGGGDTPEEAVKEARENLAVMIDYYKEKGRELPKPKTETDYNSKFFVRVSERLHKDITIFAEREGVGLNQLVNDALNLYVGIKN